MADAWAKTHDAALRQRERSARLAAQRSGRAWTLHADEQTRAVLADCARREVGAATAAEYRRVYERLCASGKTPLEAASTQAHWNKLRTAARYCMAEDAREWRAASERAMRRGDLESAQRRTERAFRLTAVMDELFLQPHRLTWKDKPKAERKPSKSKRCTSAPAPNVAAGLLLGRQERVQERHAERLAVLALTGCRPAELRAGVSLKVIDGKRGPVLHVTIKGVKVDTSRGHEARALQFPANNGAAAVLAAEAKAKGAIWRLTTTEADVRSLNRALNAGAGISCYSFRHQQGSELKAAVSSGSMSAEEAAAAMGHASTLSLSYYGSRSKARGGRKLRAISSDKVRSVPVTFVARETARKARQTKRARAAIGATPQPLALARPAPPPSTAKIQPSTPLLRGLKPPRR